MARPLRIEFAGAVYHVTSRGNGRQKIFLDEQDNRKFLELFGKTLERFNWICHAFCLMVNHYHLRADLRVRHPRRLWGWHRHQEERGSAAGAVFEESGRPSAVLRDDFLVLSTGGMTDIRKKKKGFHDSIGLEWNARSEILLVSASLPLDQIGDKFWDLRPGEIGS